MLQLTFAENAPSDIADAYDHCRQLTCVNSTTFYLSSQLLPQFKRQAIWAIYA
ncbi:hypothetical protein Q2T42_25480 [Leptolyngbya boryana CZ1]|uniref:Uncharacterized protein n=1 Tax=Leptolyngbya boryana CZ1 TaxID=3060204 RepID=A0AA97AMT4_LEPBY|nr:hypothetical protein [Leptolyngbya boryana]WNZ45143.1 hypothetical protein Q2T42_25480 [Leptolyngbya boryana CZ1]